MNNISITNFKGIAGPFNIDFNESSGNDSSETSSVEKNFLMYAENGGGKTSITEAIRAAVFAAETISLNIRANVVGEERIQAIKSIWRPLLHDRTTDNFTIKIDEDTFSMDVPNGISNKRAAILCRQDLASTPRIDFNKIIHAENVKIGEPLINFMSDEDIVLVIEEANDMLHNLFKEDIKLVRLQEEGIFIGILGILPDEQHIGDNIHLMVNEARQNIVKIVLFFSYLKILPHVSNSEDKMLVVLDDVMSSLDLANRIILARYIVDMGRIFQMFVLTHNAGFYNLVKHVVGVEGEGENWIWASLYCDEGLHKLYFPDSQESLKSIMGTFEGKITPENNIAINALRKRLEYLLREFGKILILGIQEETKDLIEKIVTSNSLFCVAEGEHIKTYPDLIHEIENLVKIIPDAETLKSKITKKIDHYRGINQMPMIAETIRHLHIYQKVILHPGSHDQAGDIIPTSQREIAMTIDLIKKLESIVKRPSTSYPYFL